MAKCGMHRGCLAVLVLVLTGSLALLISGAVLLQTGKTDRSVIEDHDPDADFQILPDACHIVEVAHATRDEKEVNEHLDDYVNLEPVCFDDFWITFEFDGGYLSSRVDTNRRGSHSCAEGSPEPRFQPGQVVPCWEPVALPVDPVYQCANSRCIKIFSPADELEEAASNANDANTTGWVVFGAGFFCLLCVVPCVAIGGRLLRKITTEHEEFVAKTIGTSEAANHSSVHDEMSFAQTVGKTLSIGDAEEQVV
mmetsp:Transcript_103332/g.236761  ORF Transcript_103332/g.236761 Transcript_103332/m.236761 type:complete len:252 (+) Transcript_103332:38-793(+)